MLILYINNKKENCPINSYGKRLYNLLYEKYKNLTYIEVENEKEYKEIQFDNFNGIVYNWSIDTMKWLNFYTIQHTLNNIGIVHGKFLLENSPTDTFLSENKLFDIMIDAFLLPRPLFLFQKQKAIIPNNPLHIFGSCGYALKNKGFPKVVKMINQQFDFAIIRLFLISTPFVDNHQNVLKEIIDDCKKNNVKPNIKLEFIIDDFEDQKILDFLYSNDMNLFLYDQSKYVTSILDYAISVNVPFGVSNSNSFIKKCLSEQANICLDKVNIKEAFENSKKLLPILRNSHPEYILLNFFNLDIIPNGLVYQDLFAYQVCGKITNGTYMDIGSGMPIDFGNNTYKLSKIGWKGINFDITNFSEDWKFYRPDHTFICADVTTMDWNKVIEENKIPQVIDYLSFDVDDATIPAMKNFPWNRIRFKVITIEHDCYRVGNETKDFQRKILKEAGYTLLCEDVLVEYGGPNDFKSFEDWWVNLTYIDSNNVKKFEAKNTLGIEIAMR